MPWTSSPRPSIIPSIPHMANVDLSGAPFTSFCRSRRAQSVPHEHLRQCTTLATRNLFHDCPRAFRRQELLQLLEKVAPTLRKLVLIDVDLRAEAGGSSAHEGNIPDARPTVPTFSLTHVNAATVLGLLSLCQRQAFQPDVIILDDCTFSSPLDIPRLR
ncbi:hypothetical protein BKA70DRAFT_1465405 [Coprinopsis sp. MPI-PUGE-AT-0042]|nr:hypothetical protein BKA70DRAFT_1465405 [Coprinopsis sp. MPI-PUGE-AT-0042]